MKQHTGIHLNFVTAHHLKMFLPKIFSLVPSKYIEFINRDENIDFDIKMQSLQTDFTELLKAEEQSKKRVAERF